MRRFLALVARYRSWSVVLAGGMIAAILAWLLWPAPTPPRQRAYRDYTACLLTDDKGITGAAAPAWAGLVEASTTTHVRVEFLSIDGEQTLDHAVVVLNTLAQWNCQLLFAAGELPLAAVARGAPTFPDVHFYIVGGEADSANVTALGGDAKTAVRRVVLQEAGSSAE